MAQRGKQRPNQTDLALKMDFLIEVNEFLHPFHRLHAAVALLDDLRKTRWNMIFINPRNLGVT